jgi:FtsP/CotA-like multicopper oxidase with cupredoxin domain
MDPNASNFSKAAQLTRRQMVSLGTSLISAATLGSAQSGRSIPATPADFVLRISEINLELGPKLAVKTTAYNGQAPGPLLRMTEGKSVAVDVVNETYEPEMIHWHGFFIPPDVDGSHEEGTPMVQGRDRRRYVFTPAPVGTRWYHTHGIAGHNLKKGLYSGQFGMVVVEPRENPARYDLDVPIILHEWDGFFSADQEMDIDFKVFTINDKVLGAGEPVRVKNGQRVLFRILNASATTQHRVALAGHTFHVVALDGNAVAVNADVPVIEVAPGERVDAIVEMNAPGVWILGEEDNRMRTSGAGVVVEYADAQGPPKWIEPAAFTWDYTRFAGQEKPTEPEARIPLVFERQPEGHGWTINGKSFPHTDLIKLPSGQRIRLIFDNRSTTPHPVHTHRHTFEITKYAGQAVSGVRKDVVVVPERSTVEVDFLANHPGPALFHCHQQFHMDFGFMALMQYS